MQNLNSSRRTGLFTATLVLCAIVSTAMAADGDKVALFNGKDTTGWKLRNPQYKQTWKVVSEVRLDANNAKLLVGSGEGGSADAALFRGPIDHGSDLISEKEFGDCQVHIEFMVPKGSNSGVYLMGEYEIQVLDSYGKPDNSLGMGDCGAIYSAKVPSVNATRPPGEWQSFDIDFRAPRFQDGKKTENARFVSIKLNGREIQKDVEVKGATGGQLGAERPKGPLMLQGDHGIVAYRNIMVTPK